MHGGRQSRQVYIVSRRGLHCISARWAYDGGRPSRQVGRAGKALEPAPKRQRSGGGGGGARSSKASGAGASLNLP